MEVNLVFTINNTLEHWAYCLFFSYRQSVLCLCINVTNLYTRIPTCLKLNAGARTVLSSCSTKGTQVACISSARFLRRTHCESHLTCRSSVRTRKRITKPTDQRRGQRTRRWSIRTSVQQSTTISSTSTWRRAPGTTWSAWRTIGWWCKSGRRWEPTPPWWSQQNCVSITTPTWS
jgi:hypothetical protein